MNLKRISDMASILPKRSGLNHKVWVSGEFPGHKPRIKVFTGNGNETISVSISDTPKQIAGKKGVISPKDMELIAQWVVLNKEVLLEYWNSDEADTVGLVESLKRI